MRRRTQVKKIETHCDTIPIFVHHHHAQEHTKREEEQSINVVLNGITDGHAECKQENLTSGIESGSKNDITDRPSVFECTENEDELGDNVYRDTYKWPKDVDDVKCNGGLVGEAKELLKGGNGDEEGTTEDEDTGNAEELFAGH